MKRPIVIVAAVLLAAPTLFAQPLVTVDADLVTAKGVTPGGAVALAFAGHVRGDWLNHVVHFQTVANDDDLDGVVTFARKKGMPPVALAVVVDLGTGQLGAASPGGAPRPTPRELPAAATDMGPEGLRQLAESGSRVDVLLVKQAEGVWARSIFDGGPLDADATADGIVTVAFARLAPLGATARATDTARAGDILVLLDPMTLRYAAARLAARAQ